MTKHYKRFSFCKNCPLRDRRVFYCYIFSNFVIMGGNQYKEKWTYEEAEKLLIEMVELSEDREYDFIGEICKEKKTYKEQINYLVDKFKDLKHYKSIIKSNLESNCFYNSKKGKINIAVGIVNLKSNHGWTDRTEQTVKQEQPLFGDE